MSNRSANMPFRFVSCMELREVLGKRAMDEHRLLELWGCSFIYSREFRMADRA